MPLEVAKGVSVGRRLRDALSRDVLFITGSGLVGGFDGFNIYVELTPTLFMFTRQSSNWFTEEGPQRVCRHGFDATGLAAGATPRSPDCKVMRAGPPDSGARAAF